MKWLKIEKDSSKEILKSKEEILVATFQIEFKNKKFTSHNGVNVEIATENHVVANGWECAVEENGDFYCIATKFYQGVRRQIRFRINNGEVKLILKIGDAKPKVLRAYKLGKWPVDGIIGLPGGFIDKRKAYFREKEFQDFLDKYGITAVRCESANGTYMIEQEVLDGNTCFQEIIETDGKLETIYNDVKYKDDTKTDSFTVYRKVQVTDATWAIKKVIKSGEITHKKLYTTENPKEILGLPKE